MVGLLGLGFSFMVNNAVENRYIEDCLQSGGSMVTALRFDIQKIDKKLVEVQVKAKVCKTPSKEALK